MKENSNSPTLPDAFVDVPRLPEEAYAVPEGDWIVLSADERRVVVHDPDLQTAIREAENQGEKHGVIMKAHNLRAHWVI